MKKIVIFFARKGKPIQNLASSTKYYAGARFETELPPASDQELLYLTVAVFTSFTGSCNLLVRTWKVGNIRLKVNQDNSCTGCVMRESLVSPHWYTGGYICAWMINGTTISFLIASVEVDSPFFTGRIHAAVVEKPLFGLIVGNVKDVKDSYGSDAQRQTKGQPPVAPKQAPLWVNLIRWVATQCSWRSWTKHRPSLAHLCKYANTGVSRTRNWGRTLFYRTKGRLFQEVTPSNEETSRLFVVPAQYLQIVMRSCH